jgi:hypothetical protein
MGSVATLVLLVTGWGSALASSLSTAVIVANPATNPAKVHEQGIAKVAVQNADASGNIKVHEQGTANVNVTNGSLPVTPPAPVTAGGGHYFCDAGASCTSATITASELQINFTSTADEVVLYNGGSKVAEFLGPGSVFNAPNSIVVPLTRPISFDSAQCIGEVSDTCWVSWISSP